MESQPQAPVPLRDSFGVLVPAGQVAIPEPEELYRVVTGNPFFSLQAGESLLDLPLGPGHILIECLDDRDLTQRLRDLPPL